MDVSATLYNRTDRTAGALPKLVVLPALQKTRKLLTPWRTDSGDDLGRRIQRRSAPWLRAASKTTCRCSDRFNTCGSAPLAKVASLGPATGMLRFAACAAAKPSTRLGVDTSPSSAPNTAASRDAFCVELRALRRQSPSRREDTQRQARDTEKEQLGNSFRMSSLMFEGGSYAASRDTAKLSDCARCRQSICPVTVSNTRSVTVALAELACPSRHASLIARTSATACLAASGNP